mmetsp:Transcript_22751/g.26731  ORF Transcript_22751/g.26731 Transcript_22751/m.26731 type:complete len:404 (+) Transcript_22751:15-1226(+)
MARIPVRVLSTLRRTPYQSFETRSLDLFRNSISQFVNKELTPTNVHAWDEAGRVPESIFQKAGDIGILGVGYPSEYGGLGNDVSDLSYFLVLNEEMAKAGSGGLLAALLGHNIALPPILELGSEELKQKVLPAVLSGQKRAALAITEPGGGSDVAAVRTSARLEGDHYILNGSKTFITGGMDAHYITTAVRTGGEGAGGLSLMVVDADTPGVHRTELPKTGWLCSDTATITFEDAPVHVSNLIGRENKGFLTVMRNFNTERIMLAAQSIYFSELLLDEALKWAKERRTFGCRLVDHQVMRHKLVDMATQCATSRAYLHYVADAYKEDGNADNIVQDICMLKNAATDCMHFCADGAVQTMGGAGFIRGHAVERLYREVKVMQIGGGSTEIMKELAAKHLGFMTD